MSKWNGNWGVCDLSTGKDIESHPTKIEAMKVVDGLNELEVYASRYKKYGVTPLTSTRLNALKNEESGVKS